MIPDARFGLPSFWRETSECKQISCRASKQQCPQPVSNTRSPSASSSRPPTFQIRVPDLRSNLRVFCFASSTSSSLPNHLPLQQHEAGNFRKIQSPIVYYRCASITYSWLYALPSDSGRFHALPLNLLVHGSASVCSFKILFNVQSNRLLLIPRTSAVRLIRIECMRGKPVRKKAFGRDSTSLDVLGDNCQYRKRFQALPI